MPITFLICVKKSLYRGNLAVGVSDNGFVVALYFFLLCRRQSDLDSLVECLVSVAEEKFFPVAIQGS